LSFPLVASGRPPTILATAGAEATARANRRCEESRALGDPRERDVLFDIDADFDYLATTDTTYGLLRLY
jgi:hypothetical protein